MSRRLRASGRGVGMSVVQSAVEELSIAAVGVGEELGQVVLLYGYELSYASVTLIIHLLLLL